MADDPILALAEPGTLTDPYPALARLRETQPIFWYPRFESWILTRYVDAVEVLRDSTRFGSDWRRAGEDVPPQALSVQTLDPPEHTAVRRPLMEALRTVDGPALEASIAGHTATLLDRLAGRSRFDFVTDLAEPLALHTTMTLLGVPAPDLGWFVPVADAIADGMDAGLWPEKGERAMPARAELAAYTAGWLDDPAPHGLVGQLARHTGDDVERTVLANTLRVLLHAGYTSASKVLGLAAAALLGTGGFGRFPVRAPGPAVEELTRYCSPVQALARVCVENTTLGGVPMRAGQAVTLLLGAANRDPDRFPRPDELRFDRAPNPHLGFGRGAHSCLGSPVANRQTRIVFDVLARYPELRAAGAPEYRHNLTLRGLRHLPVAWR
ncbi:MAG: cytochrome P450 [Actinocatenispora sp.]